SRRLGGNVARMLLPAVFSLPLVMGWVRLQGEKLGLFHLEVGMAIHTVATMTAFGVLVWYCAKTLDDADQEPDMARKSAGERRLLAEFDPLTHFLNRRSLSGRLADEWDRSCRYDRPLSCIMLDLDSFKAANDRWGHLVGDSVLKTVAALIARQCRPSDLLC